MSGVMIGAAVIGAAATVYSSGQATKAAKKQATAQRESQAAQQKSSSADAARARLNSVREARMRSGAVTAEAGSGGFGQASSGVAGSISSIGSQLGTNIGGINVKEGFAEIASVANQKAADAGADIMKWQQIGAISQTIFSTATSRIK